MDASNSSGEQHHVLLPDDEEHRVGLEREILDPSTSLDRLSEILKLVQGYESSTAVNDSGELRQASDYLLNHLLLDGSTPLDVIQEIQNVISERRTAEGLPPEE